MLKKHHFMNLSVMRENSFKIHKCLLESKDYVFDMMNEKINSSKDLSSKLNEIIEEHQSNYENLEEFDLEENLHDL